MSPLDPSGGLRRHARTDRRGRVDMQRHHGPGCVEHLRDLSVQTVGDRKTKPVRRVG
jgi:hypothetical protein